MINTQLCSLLTAQPFRALRLRLSDGREVRIKHPEAVATSPTGRTAIVFHDDEAFEAIDVQYIISIEVDGAKKQRSNNKRSSKKRSRKH